jgi:hypothetical protein
MDKDPIGKTISIVRDRAAGMNDYMVTGILEEIPDNSHFKFDILGSFETFDIMGIQNADQSKEERLNDSPTQPVSSSHL